MIGDVWARAVEKWERRPPRTLAVEKNKIFCMKNQRAASPLAMHESYCTRGTDDAGAKKDVAFLVHWAGMF